MMDSMSIKKHVHYDHHKDRNTGYTDAGDALSSLEDPGVEAS